MQKYNATIINYYFHCKRQAYLFAKRVGMEHNSFNVKIGKSLHKYYKNRVKEVHFKHFSVDKLTKEYVIEIKKSDSFLVGAKWQLIFYLYQLKQKGINKKGRLEVFQKYQQNTKRAEIILNKKIEDKLKNILSQIDKLLKAKHPPKALLDKKCQGCSYYDYCFV